MAIASSEQKRQDLRQGSGVSSRANENLKMIN